MRTSLFLVALNATLLGAAHASAQTTDTRPERPYRGVYAGGTSESAQVLSVSGSAGVGYDTNPQQSAAEAGFGTIGAPTTSDGSFYNQFSGSLSYSAGLDRVTFGASGSASGRLYPELDTPVTTSYAASTGASATLGSRTSVRAGLSGTFHSMRNFTPFPDLGLEGIGQLDAPSLDFGYGRARYSTYSADASVNHQLSQRSSLSLGYGRQNTAFSGDFEDLISQTGSIRYSRGLTRYLSLRLGYGYSEARYGAADRQYQTHNLDTGVDYSRSLSITRRTTFAFSTGATALKQQGDTRFDAIGSATLSREIGRSWQASLAYQRSAGYVQSLLEPTFADSVSGAFNGLITRRLSFHSGVGASRGSVGFVRSSTNGFDAVNAFTGVGQALTRHLALNVNYSFYRYNFESGAAIASALIPHLNRHSVSVSLSAWAPLFQHGRKKNASR
jgi:hypothetical protein